MTRHRNNLVRYLRDIFHGESPGAGPAGARSSLLVCEEGMISIVAVITVLMFAALVALVANIGIAVNQKIELQNAADAAATSCTLQRARRWNAITAANHLAGELMAIVVLHESIGRRYESDSREGVQDTDFYDDKLRIQKEAHEANEKIDPNPQEIKSLLQNNMPPLPAYDDVSSDVHAVYALLDSYKSLKKWLTRVYELKNFALLIFKFRDPYVPYVGPFFRAAGIALYQIGNLVERYIQFEWKFLKGIENFAKNTVEERNFVYGLIPKIMQATARMLEETNVLTDTAKAIGARHNATVDLFPPRLFEEEQTQRTRLMAEPEKVDRSNVPTDPVKEWHDPKEDFAPASKANEAQEKARKNVDLYKPFRYSQIVRATYPWVNYHRQPAFELTRPLIFSQAAEHYRNWSSLITLTKCADYYREGKPPLYVISGLDPERKGDEIWTKVHREAEQRFTIMAFAYRPPPERWGRGVFPQTNDAGTVAYSQAILYNANAQKNSVTIAPPRHFQPEVGWDTLNWDTFNNQSTIRSSAALEWPKFSKNTGCPQIRLNWQAKLVPASRLEEARKSGQLNARIMGVLNKLEPKNVMDHSH